MDAAAPAGATYRSECARRFATRLPEILTSRAERFSYAAPPGLREFVTVNQC
jgi:hypothetical protein